MSNEVISARGRGLSSPLCNPCNSCNSCLPSASRLDMLAKASGIEERFRRITMQQNGPKTAPRRTDHSSGRPAILVASGIMLSRIAGLVRERAVSRIFLGIRRPAAVGHLFERLCHQDSFHNLFGEGVLSQTPFIPVYSRLLGSSDEKVQIHVASVVGGLPGFADITLVILGIMSTTGPH